jgi:AraC-like DNA-binding protein
MLPSHPMTFRHVYRELPVAPPLRPFVECYWYAVSAAGPGFRPMELLVPDLKVELILNAGARYGWAAGPDAAVRPSARFTCIGMRGRSIGVQQLGRLDHFGIRLRPGGAAALLGVPMAELTQTCVPLGALWGAAGGDLEDRLLEAASVPDRVRAADRFLLARLARAPGSDEAALARSCVGELLRSVGAAAIGRVARDHGLGYKRLERVFLRQVGLTPKHVARIARLQHALGSARPSVPLADLALQAGYADQAHLTRDFAQLIGRSPRAFFEERFAVFETMKASGAIGRR